MIRAATTEDAISLIQIHHAAVHGISGFYSPEILEAWSRRPDEARFTWMRELIAQRDAVVLVAERQGTVSGFGILIPELSELRVYVRPPESGNGVGQKLLNALEVSAGEHGVTYLQVNASLNAGGFYLRHGYETLSASTLCFSGQHLACSKMGKTLEC